MVTKNLFNPAISMIGGLKEQSRPAGGGSSSMDFDRVMDKTVKNDSPAQNNADSANTKNNQEVKDSAKPDEVNKPQQPLKGEDGKVQTGKAEKPGDIGTEKTDITNGTGELSQEELETAMEAVLSQIMQTVTEALGITKEQLTEAMDTLGMEPADLLEPSNGAKLVLELNGTDDITDLLTNEDLSRQLKTLTDALDNMGKEDGLTKEVMSDILRQADALAANSVNEKQAGAEPDRKAAGAPEKNEEPEQKEITITVEKQTSEKPAVKEEMTGKDHQNRRNDKQDTQAGMVEAFVENLAVKGKGQIDLSGAMERIETMREIVSQVVEQIKVTVKPTMSSMELQLNPEHLGRINLSVAAKDGVLTATFTAQNEIAKEALESQVQVLRDNLSEQGLKVEAIEVTVSSFEFNFSQNSQMDQKQNQKDNASPRRINLDDFDEGSSDVTEEEILAAKVMEQNGGSVDYTA